MGKLNDVAQNFLLYSYFGFDSKNLDKYDDVMEKCAHRAYLDLNRTLNFKEKLNGKKNEEIQRILSERTKFRNQIIYIIEENIEKLQNGVNDFDSWHKNTCERICKEANEKEILNVPLHYGQAQKWLNMTIKYIWILNGLTNVDEKMLHIPIDNFILQAVYENIEINSENCLKDKISVITKNEQYTFNKKSWSKMEYEDYIEFQEKMKDMVKNRIEWECRAWIDVAKKRSIE